MNRMFCDSPTRIGSNPTPDFGESPFPAASTPLEGLGGATDGSRASIDHSFCIYYTCNPANVKRTARELMQILHIFGQNEPPRIK